MGWFDDFVNTIADVVVNVASAGVVSYKDGKLGKGYNLRTLDESLGEVTGRNMARRDAADNREKVKQAEAEQRKLYQDELKRKQEKDTQASNSANSYRNTPSETDIINTGVKQRLGADPNRDFLGL